MKQIYEWSSNIIKFSDKYENEFELELRGRVTVIYGASATGKTLVCNRIKQIQNDDNIGAATYVADNILLVERSNKDKIYEKKQKLIVIDKAERLLDDKLIEHINQDGSNRYLLMLRKPVGIDATPNHYGVLSRERNKVMIEYKYDIGGKFMGERLTWEEMQEKYPERWLGLIDIKYRNDDGVSVESAVIKYTDKTKDELGFLSFKEDVTPEYINCVLT